MKLRSKSLGIFAIGIFALAGCGSNTGDSTGSSASGSSDASGSSATDSSAGGSSETQPPAAPATLRVGQVVPMESGDPADVLAPDSVTIRSLMFETLVDHDDDGTIIPKLATSWEVIDDLNWRFELRDDVKFHDGSPMTSADVVFSFERLLDESQALKNGDVYQFVTGVKADGDHAVIFTTDKPYSPFLPLLALDGQIVPKDYVEKVGVETFAQEPIGTGPYQFESWQRDKAFNLTAFADYWGEAPHYDKVSFTAIPEDAARVAALQTGEIDVASAVPAQLVKGIESQDGISIKDVPGVTTMSVVINANNPPLDDVRVRQALNYAVDKQTLIDTLFGGYATWTGGVFGAAIVGWTDDVQQSYPYDPEKAKALLAEAGFATGLEITLDSPRDRYPQDANLAQAIAAQLEAVGIKVNLNIIESGTWVQQYVNGEIKNLTILQGPNATLDADEIFTKTMSPQGRKYYVNDEFTDMLMQSRAEFDPDKRTKLLQEMHVFAVEKAVPAIFLFDTNSLWGVADSVCDFEPRANLLLPIAEMRPCA